MSEMIGQVVQHAFMNNAGGLVYTVDPLLGTHMKYLITELTQIGEI